MNNNGERKSVYNSITIDRPSLNNKKGESDYKLSGDMTPGTSLEKLQIKKWFIAKSM